MDIYTFCEVQILYIRKLMDKKIVLDICSLKDVQDRTMAAFVFKISDYLLSYDVVSHVFKLTAMF